MGKSHERPVEPFSDVHAEHGEVIATLLHDPTVEGLDMAIYLDGSASMTEEYEKKVTDKFISWLLGKAPTVLPNQVEPQVQWMLEYLATKDRNGALRVAYWACGSDGKDVEVIGEITGAEVRKRTFEGPRKMGTRTMLLPAMKDYVAYMKDMANKGARQGCAVFITDGQIHDVDLVKSYAASLASDMVRGRLPRCNFILVGVGDNVNEEQMEDICHAEYPGLGHLWCHRIAAEIHQVAELVAVLVDETMTVAAGGTVYDDEGNVVKIYEGRLPAVLKFEVPDGTKSFTLEVNGQRFTQPIPDDDDDHDEAHA